MEEGGQLNLDLHGLTGGAKHFHYDVFEVADELSPLKGKKVIFQMNKNGDIDRVAILLEPTVKDIVFLRKGEHKP